MCQVVCITQLVAQSIHGQRYSVSTVAGKYVSSLHSTPKHNIWGTTRPCTTPAIQVNQPLGTRLYELLRSLYEDSQEHNPHTMYDIYSAVAHTNNLLLEYNCVTHLASLTRRQILKERTAQAFLECALAMFGLTEQHLGVPTP